MIQRGKDGVRQFEFWKRIILKEEKVWRNIFHLLCEEEPVWPECAIFCTLGNHLKLVATITLRKSHTLLAIFVKVSKLFIFLEESFLGNFYRHLAILIWSHWEEPSSSSPSNLLCRFSLLPHLPFQNRTKLSVNIFEAAKIRIEIELLCRDIKIIRQDQNRKTISSKREYEKPTSVTRLGHFWNVFVT